jgi:hypothetical protein
MASLSWPRIYAFQAVAFALLLVPIGFLNSLKTVPRGFAICVLTAGRMAASPSALLHVLSELWMRGLLRISVAAMAARRE